jgi:peptidoglycan/LPS O-acetylase OafA/YrhL
VLLLAVMFTGTVVYRAQHRQMGRWASVLTLLVVIDCLVVAHAAYGNGPVWVATVAAVVLTFAAAFALRNRRVPKLLTWLGTVSYSLYLLHVLVLGQVIRLVPDLDDRPVPVRLAFAAAFLVVALVCARLSYRWIELPAQAFGRRLLRDREVRVATQRGVARTGRGENGAGSV